MEIKQNRKQRRANKKEQIQSVSRFKLAQIVTKQLEIIFDGTLACDNPDKEEKYKDFRPLFEQYMIPLTDPFHKMCADTEVGKINMVRYVDEALLYKKNKKALLSIYSKTAKAAYWLAKYHDLPVDVINTIKGNDGTK